MFHFHWSVRSSAVQYLIIRDNNDHKLLHHYYIIVELPLNAGAVTIFYQVMVEHEQA